MLTVGTKGSHAALVGDAGVISARRAEEISIEVRQIVVVALDALDQLPMPETASTASTHASLGPNHRSSQDVIASVPELPIYALAGLFACGVGDVVMVIAVLGRDGVGAAAVGEGYLLEALLGESEGAKLAGGWVRGFS